MDTSGGQDHKQDEDSKDTSGVTSRDSGGEDTVDKVDSGVVKVEGDVGTVESGVLKGVSAVGGTEKVNGDMGREAVASLASVEDGASIRKPAPRPDKLVGVRHLQALLMFLGILVAYSLRINLSVSIVAIVDRHSANPDYPEYDWDERTQSIVLSSFFWGYCLMQFPGGPLAERFGPKILLTLSLLTASLASILTPLAADLGGWPTVCAVRVVLGLSQGIMFPSFHNMLAHWTPAQERGRLVTFVYAGAQFGTIVSMPVCGLLATSSWGWPSTFYVFGALGVAWTVLWAALGSNSPAEDRLISLEERHYIEDSLATAAKEDMKNSTPWRSIITSVPVWAVIAANCGHSWGFWTLMTEMPTYMKTVLGFELKKNGFLSSLPYLVNFLLSFVFSSASDYVNKKQLLTLTASRKLFNCIAQWIPAVALVGVAYAGGPRLAIGLLTLAVGVNSANYVGFNIAHIDLSPNYAGTLVGLTNGFGNIMSLLGPLVVGVVVTQSGSVIQWRYVFFIAAAIYFLSNLIFVLFATAELQPWNEPTNHNATSKSEQPITESDGLSLKMDSVTVANYGSGATITTTT